MRWWVNPRVLLTDMLVFASVRVDPGRSFAQFQMVCMILLVVTAPGSKGVLHCLFANKNRIYSH